MQVENKYVTRNPEETQKIGEDVARSILDSGKKTAAVVLALEGDLGAGKTTFTQGFAKGLGVREKVLSPTFVVMKRFPLEDGRFKNFFHLDCYRMETEADATSMNLKEIFSNPENIVLIEWPERISKILPAELIRLHFRHLEESKREIEVVY